MSGAARTELGAILVAIRRMVSAADLVEALNGLCDYLRGWSEDELDVLGMVAARLDMGRELYGVLDIGSDRRDWAAEARDEAIDLVIYRAIGAVEAMRGREGGRAG